MNATLRRLHLCAAKQIAILFVAVVALSSLTGLASAQGTTDQSLYIQGQQAYQQRQWVDAAMFLKAYVERNPASMAQNASHRQAVLKALQFARDKAKGALQRLPLVEEQLAQCQLSVDAETGVHGFLLEASSSTPPALPLPANPEPVSYPLVCRGGGSLGFGYGLESSVSAKPHLRITYEKAALAAGMQQEDVGVLQPGQCTWLDRTINSDEPDRIVLREPLFNERDFSINWQYGQVTDISSALPYLGALQSEDLVQTFQVYNDGYGNFIVTGIDSPPNDFPY